MHEPFSLLLSVYDGDRPEFLRRAYHSAIDEQTVRPAEAIIVQDGPVRPELADCLDKLRAGSPVPVMFLQLPANGGLGPALDAGLAAASHDVIARMDADDIAMPNRFAVQLPLISAGADIVGAGLLEFDGDLDDIVGRRVPPTKPDDIRRYAKIHDPFNHPTVVYRREAVLKVGGYGANQALMEDYWLFSRMLAAGAEPRNAAAGLSRARRPDRRPSARRSESRTSCSTRRDAPSE